MPEQSYRPRHNVSRQFTEAELAVSDRTTDHLTQEVDQLPPARLAPAVGGDTAYAWLEKDLKRRDEQTVRLAREMALAEQQSLRNQLDAEARQEADMKSAAADGVSYISSWQENGFRSMDEAVQDYKKKNPGIVMNPEFNAAHKSLLDGFKTDEQREFEDITQKTLLAKSIIDFQDAEHMRLDMEENPEKWMKMRDSLLDARIIGALDSVEQAKFDLANRAHGRQQATTNMKLWGMTDPGDGSLAMRQMEALDIAGLSVSDPGRLQSFYKPDSPELQMILDGAHLAKQKPETKAGIEQALNVLTNPKSDDDQLLEARRLIEKQSLSYWKETKDLRESELLKKQVAAKLPAASKAVADSFKANHSLLKGYKDEAINADPAILVAEMTANARVALNQIKSELMSAGVPLDEYAAAVLEIDELSKKAELKSSSGAFGKITENETDDKETAKARILQAASFSRQINDITNKVLEAAMKAERNPTKTVDPESDVASTPLKAFDDNHKKEASKLYANIEDVEKRKEAYRAYAAERGLEDPFPKK